MQSKGWIPPYSALSSCSLLEAVIRASFVGLMTMLAIVPSVASASGACGATGIVTLQEESGESKPEKESEQAEPNSEPSKQAPQESSPETGDPQGKSKKAGSQNQQDEDEKNDDKRDDDKKDDDKKDDDKKDDDKKDDGKKDDGKKDDGKKDDGKKDDKKDTKKPKLDGAQDLNKAFDLKLEARTTQDLDRIAQLCENALRKGLNKKDTLQAKKLSAKCSLEFASQLSQRIFNVGELDRRWQYYRSQALPRLKKAIEYNDQRAEAFVLLAKLQSLPGGDRDEASEAIDKAIKLAGDDDLQRSEALYVRASLQQDNQQKLSDLNQAIQLNPENLEALQVRAAYYVARGQAKRALKDFRVWLGAQPDNYEARVLVVESLMETGDGFDESMQKAAIAILDEAISIKSDFTVPYTFKAEIYSLADNSDEVVKAADLAIKYEPKNIKALKLRANALAELGMFEKAVSDADEVIKLQGLSLEGVELRGLIRIQQGDYERAIEDFETLSGAQPSNSALKQQLAALYSANDQPSKAIKIYTSLLRRLRKSVWDKQEPEVKAAMMMQRVDLLHGRGDAQLSTGEHDKAVDDYDEALELAKETNQFQTENKLEVTPIDDAVLNNLAWVLATSPDDDVRDGERSVQLATRAAEMTEFQQAHILSTLASGYAETEDFETAIKWVEKALEINRKLAAEAVDQTATDRQFKSLNKELDSYKQNKPWREKQNVEGDKKAKPKKGGSDD